MSLVPRVNLRRTFLIARRDYLGYVKTWGFWISFLLPFLFGGFGFFMAQADLDFSPPQYATVLDMTGEHEARLMDLHAERKDDRAQGVMSGKAFFIQDKTKRAEFNRVLRSEGTVAAQAYLKENVPGVRTEFEMPEDKFKFVPPPASSLEGLMPYLLGEKMISVDGQPTELGGAVIFKKGESRAQPQTEYWSTNVNKVDVPDLLDVYLRRMARVTYLETQGLSVAELDRRVDTAPEAVLFNPTKVDDADQGVDSSDTVPFIVAGVLAFFLIASLAVTTTGPFASSVTSAAGGPDGVVSLVYTVTNEGDDEGVADCRVTRDGVPRPEDLAFRTGALPGGETVTFERELAAPQAAPGYDVESLTVDCT